MAKAFSFAATAAVSAAICFLAASTGLRVCAGEKAQLTGRWEFNPDVSDKAGQKVREAQQGSRPQSEGEGQSYPGTGVGNRGNAGHYPGVGVDQPVPGGGIRMGDPGGTAGGETRSPIGGAGGGVNYPGGNGSDPGTGVERGGPDQGGKRAGASSSGAWDWLTRNPKFLRVDQQAKGIAITDDSGHAQTYFPDGKKHVEKDANGNKVSTKTTWDGSALITETSLGPSEMLTKTFRRSKDGNQLYVKTRFETPRLVEPVNIRRVYNLAKAPTN